MLILKKIISHIVTSISACSFARILAIFFMRYRFAATLTGKSIIFVLDEPRFREDIQILKNNTNIYYVNYPNWLQDKIIAILEISRINSKKKWLSKFIKCLCEAIDSIGFISAGMYYRRHEIWEVSTILANRRFYCLHREGIGADKKTVNNSLKSQFLKARKFYGTKLMVGTETLKELLIKINYISSDRIVVTGMPRFDKIYHYTNNKLNTVQETNTVLLFSFFISTIKNFNIKDGLYAKTGGFIELFNQVHYTVAQFAIDNPKINVIIKMKWYSGNAKESVDTAIKGGTGLWPDQIGNLKVLDDIPAQKLIKESRVIIGFNSTTLIESVLYGKNVIVPSFAEASQEKYIDDVFFSNKENIFYRAYSLVELMNLITNCYHNENKKLTIDRSFIEETVGPYDGNACLRIEGTIAHE
jgi:hypothetical protein